MIFSSPSLGQRITQLTEIILGMFYEARICSYLRKMFCLQLKKEEKTNKVNILLEITFPRGSNN